MIKRFKYSDAIEICDGIMFDFYMELPHVNYYNRAARYIHTLDRSRFDILQTFS